MEKSNLPQISMDAQGLLKPKNHEELKRVAAFYAKSGWLPTRFNTPEKVLVAMQYCMELKLQPLTAMRQIAIVNGTPSTYGDLPLAIVRQSNKLEYIREFIFDQDGSEICLKNKNLAAKPFGAYCEMKRREEPEISAVFTMDDAQNAGLVVRSDSWKKYPKDMLKYRARSRVIKDGFADLLNGASITEYDYEMIPEEDREYNMKRTEKARADLTAHFTVPQEDKPQDEPEKAQEEAEKPQKRDVNNLNQSEMEV